MAPPVVIPVPAISPATVPSTSAVAAAAHPTPSATQSAQASALSKLDTLTPTVDAKIAGITFSGLGPDGIPTGFSATDLTGDTGKLIIGKPAPVITDNGITLTAPVMSYDPMAVNVLIKLKAKLLALVSIKSFP